MEKNVELPSLKNLGLGVLTNENLFQKAAGTDGQRNILAWDSKEDKLVVLDKKRDITFVNRIRTLWGGGPLAHRKWDLGKVAEMTEKKLINFRWKTSDYLFQKGDGFAKSCPLSYCIKQTNELEEKNNLGDGEKITFMENKTILRNIFKLAYKADIFKGKSSLLEEVSTEKEITAEVKIEGQRVKRTMKILYNEVLDDHLLALEILKNFNIDRKYSSMIRDDRFSLFIGDHSTIKDKTISISDLDSEVHVYPQNQAIID